MQLHDLISYSRGGVMSKVLFKTERLNVTLFSMAEGTQISEHTATREGLVHIIEGEGFFTLEGRQIPIRGGVIFHMSAGAPHSISVSKDTSFLLVLAS